VRAARWFPVARLACLRRRRSRVAERTLGCSQGGLSAGTLAFSLLPIVLYGIFTVIRQNVRPLPILLHHSLTSLPCQQAAGQN
jgi:hypothetical protein